MAPSEKDGNITKKAASQRGETAGSRNLISEGLPDPASKPVISKLSLSGAPWNAAGTAGQYQGILSLSTVQMGFPSGSDGKESACNTGDLGSIPGLGRSPGEGNGCLIQYSCLENPTDRKSWRVIVRGVARSQTQLSD